MHTVRMTRRWVAVVVMVSVLVVSTSALVGADSNEGRPGVPRGAGSAISAGFDHSCVLLANGNVKCWGSGGSGQVGQGNPNQIGYAPNQMGDNLAPVALGTGRTATAITAGGADTCALLDNGTIKCWGSGVSGRLGQGNTNDIGNAPNQMGNNLAPVALGTGRTATAVTAGNHTCALLDNDTVKCWGSGFFGQVGQGNPNNIGDAPNEMGDSLAPVALGAGRTGTAVTAGDFHTCALLDNGTVKCWGFGASGQLGQGNTNNIGNAPNQMGDSLAPVALGTGRTATAVTAGDFHTCALLDNGAVKCWGSGGNGQVGQGNTNNIGNAPNQMGDNLAPIALGAGRTATAVTGGGGHTCALLDNGTVKCWGFGASGQLGQGNTNNIGNAPNQMGDNLAPVPLGAGRTATAVTAGNAHTCASLDNGTVKCWGSGGGGRLGQGNTNNIGTSASEMAILQPVALGSVPGAAVVPVVVTPAAPTGLSGSAGLTSVLLSWVSPGDNGGAPVTGYRVEMSTDNALNWATAVADTGSTAATRTIDGLATGQPVTFRVAAINNHGVGARSIPSAPLTPTTSPVPTTSPPGAFPAGSGYVSLDPVRLLDTRPDGGTIDGLFHPGTKLAGGQEIRLQVGGRGGVPATAAAVVLNVTVTEPDAAGYLTAYPCDTPRPNASNLNYSPGQTIPNNVIVKTGTSGTVCLYSQQTTHLIADINGAFP
jgi:alpha-tubulin suppressor-like RCC1 family protein